MTVSQGSVARGTRQTARWWLWALLGLANFSLGALVLLWPGPTVLVFVSVLGGYMAVFGTLRFVIALVDAQIPQRGFVALMGILGVVAGLVVLRSPFRSLAVLVVLFGLYWLFSGLVDLFDAVSNPSLPERRLVGLLGATTAAAGCVVLLWPAISATALSFVAGAYLIVGGIGHCTIAYQARQAGGAQT